MILIYIVIASLSGPEVKVNESIPFTEINLCKLYVTRNQTDMLDSARRVYGETPITEMGCVSMNKRELQPMYYYNKI